MSSAPGSTRGVLSEPRPVLLTSGRSRSSEHLDGLNGRDTHLRAGLEAFLEQADPAKCSPQVRPSIESLRETLPPIWEAMSVCVGSTQLVSRIQVHPA